MRTSSLCILAAAIACGGGSVAEPDLPLTLRTGEAQLVPGQTTQLEVLTVPAGAAGTTFSSSAPAVATVNAQGVVTAVAPGTVTFTAQRGAQRGSTVVTVQQGGVITPSGGTIRTTGGELEVTAPAGAVDTTTPIALSIATAPPWVDPTLVRGALFSIGREGQHYLKPLTVRGRYNSAAAPYGLAQAALGLRRALPAGTWQDLRPSIVDSLASTVTASTSDGGLHSIGRLVPTTACTGAAHHAFDFWVGSWNMTNGGQSAGENFITAESTGCAIFENYVTPTNLSPGRSISFYDPTTDQWYQTYIDAGNNMVQLRSTAYSGQRIPMVSPPQGNVYSRTTWSLNPDGSVRQLIEATGSNGQSFTVQYDLLYRRK